jgi:hypothetical protein
MRIHAIWLMTILALAGCAKAGAATVDPNDDFDCAVTTGFFMDAAKVSEAPEVQQHALYVVNGWFAAKWRAEHPSASAEESHAAASSIFKVIQADPMKYTTVLQACTERATGDPKFDRFAKLVR